MGVCIVLQGCGCEPVAPPVDHVVLIVVDTLRADAVGCYGGAARTPNMDRLAAEGLRFANARSHAPITGPSHACLFTSLWPAEHGVRNNAQHLDAAVPTMASLLAQEGFATAAFVSLGVLKAKFGISHGFQHYVDDFGLDWFLDAAEVNRRVLGWCGGKAPPRGLLWVHYSDPHEPYSAPDREYPAVRVSVQGREIAELRANGRVQKLSVPLSGGRETLRFEAATPPPGEGELVTLVDGRLSAPGTMNHGNGLYPWFEEQTRHDYVTALPAHLEVAAEDRTLPEITLQFGVGLKLPPEATREAYLYEVEFVDRRLGELLERLAEAGWLDNALIVLCSDHGEGLGDHDLAGHIHQLYDSLLQVPLIVWQPGVVPAGVVDQRVAGLVDILPTVMRRAGLPIPAGLRGRDLLGPAASAPLLAKTFRPEADRDLEAVVFEGYKLIRDPAGGGEELFDLATDPAELEDLSAYQVEQRAGLERRLDLLTASLSHREAATVTLDAESGARLRALGYTH